VKKQRSKKNLTTFAATAFAALITAASAALNTSCAKKEPQEQPSCGFVQNIYGQRISWKTAEPIQLNVHTSFPSEYLPALENAMNAWNISTGRKKFIIANRNFSGPLVQKKDGVSVIYWFNEWEPEKIAEQARTSIYWAGNVMQEADMRINNKAYTFYLNQPITYTEVHLESLLIHELGHVLGLKHRETAGSVMATYLSASTVRNKVSAEDVTDLTCEY
jgi:hypothetical protein